jgi:hypothetical protein
MELFIPSLLVLVLGAIVLFVFMPKWSPYTLGLLSFALLALGLFQHYSMFPYEYKASVLQAAAQDYAPFIMIAAVILGGTIAVMLTWGGSPPSVAAVANSIPAVAAITPTTVNRPANNKGASITNSIFGGNTARRNNIASNSFKTV